ncbi:MAG: hypothetical protein IH823_07360 [Candidatus Dadabacteria bacterium]|nr:hypothetical protein [Candidatus Dadabacteria bacterium]
MKRKEKNIVYAKYASLLMKAEIMQRNARIIVPHDIKEEEIEKLKKLLDVLK